MFKKVIKELNDTQKDKQLQNIANSFVISFVVERIKKSACGGNTSHGENISVVREHFSDFYVENYEFIRPNREKCDKFVTNILIDIAKSAGLAFELEKYKDGTISTVFFHW